MQQFTWNTVGKVDSELHGCIRQPILLSYHHISFYFVAGSVLTAEMCQCRCVLADAHFFKRILEMLFLVKSFHYVLSSWETESEDGRKDLETGDLTEHSEVCNYPHPPTLNRLQFLSGLATSEFGQTQRKLAQWVRLILSILNKLWREWHFIIMKNYKWKYCVPNHMCISASMTVTPLLMLCQVILVTDPSFSKFISIYSRRLIL